MIIIYRAVLLIGLVFLAAACSPQGSAPAALPTGEPVIPTTPETAAFSDPFAYCAAVRALDAPDERYTGEKVPADVIEGFKKSAGLEDSSMPAEMWQKTTIWRCMDSQVYACNFGANLPCDSKANTSKIPTQSMLDFCKANPGSEFIPMSETGHDTIYSWRCVGESAEVDKLIAEVDPAGFIANIWYRITPPNQ